MTDSQEGELLRLLTKITVALEWIALCATFILIAQCSRM